jgi:Stress up-regulated Nod 19
MSARTHRLVPSLLLALVAALATTSPAYGSERTFQFLSKPVVVAGYGTVEAPEPTPAPPVDGYVVGMNVDVVDRSGKPLPDFVLHHVVFLKLGVPDATCPQGFEGLPIVAQRFHGEGEERTKLALPSGFGYPNRATDRWLMVYMLMNHDKRKRSAFIRYTVRYVTGEAMTPVTPLWLDVHNCTTQPEFDVPGTGRRGSTFTRSADFLAPESGSLVWGSGHLHGGGIRLEVRNVTCNTTPYTALPTWGHGHHHMLLHEPGPVKMSSFTSAEGIPVSAGDRIRLSAVYDNSRPHTRVMGIMLVYFAPRPVFPCAPTPPLALDLGNPGLPPLYSLGLPRPPHGPLYRNRRSTWVGDSGFGHERISITPGRVFTWRFVGRERHDVTVLGGPVGFSSPRLTQGTFRYRFTRPGTYRIVCSLHPAMMVQLITVRRRSVG